jgi:hypothetical protein
LSSLKIFKKLKKFATEYTEATEASGPDEKAPGQFDLLIEH